MRGLIAFLIVAIGVSLGCSTSKEAGVKSVDKCGCVVCKCK